MHVGEGGRGFEIASCLRSGIGVYLSSIKNTWFSRNYFQIGTSDTTGLAWNHCFCGETVEKWPMGMATRKMYRLAAKKHFLRAWLVGMPSLYTAVNDFDWVIDYRDSETDAKLDSKIPLKTFLWACVSLAESRFKKKLFSELVALSNKSWKTTYFLHFFCQ